MNLTFPLKKSVLTARVMAMTEKQSKLAEASATVPSASPEGSSVSPSALSAALAQKATDSQSDQLLLLTALRSAVDALSVYLSGESFGVASVTDTLCDDCDDFLITMEGSDRFNSVMRQPLVSAFSDFIVRFMLYQWYSAFSDSLAQSHHAALPAIQQTIARCFRKVSGSCAAGLFPSEVHFDKSFLPNEIFAGNQVCIPYTIVSDNPDVVNDIVLKPFHCTVQCSLHSDSLFLHFRAPGTYSIRIFSYHDPSVSDCLTLTVLPHV